jgi:hypothetical protein
MENAALWSKVMSFQTESLANTKACPGKQSHKNFVAWNYSGNEGFNFRPCHRRSVLLCLVNDGQSAKLVVPLARVKLIALGAYRRCDDQFKDAGVVHD